MKEDMTKVQIKLIVDVDTTNDFICPSGDPTKDNCVINTIESDFFEDPVEIVEVKEIE